MESELRGVDSELLGEESEGRTAQSAKPKN